MSRTFSLSRPATALLAFCLFFTAQTRADGPEPVRFNTQFEGGSLGKVEHLGHDAYRCHVQGQHDEHGRNRQASWYDFRIDGARGRTLSLTLTDFVGEYNGKPGACPMGPDIVPVYSEDGEHWQSVPEVRWDDKAKEATITLTPKTDSVWIAHQVPYTPQRLTRLLDQVAQSDDARIEVIGKTVQGRDLLLVSVTDPDEPDQNKPVVWLQARQHAWESGTSFVMEGALRFITSDDPKAQSLRKQVLFKFTPMADPDGSSSGQVRFNANGYDFNRHWDEVDLRHKTFFTLMPEIWYVKKAIRDQAANGPKIAILLNMHNTETSEYLQTMADDETSLALISEVHARLVREAGFRPSRGPDFGKPDGGSINALYAELGIPVVLMEQRIARDPETGHVPSPKDRLAFGENLIRIMAESALAHHHPSGGR